MRAVMQRTPDGLRIVDGMIELPRNPVDEKIDGLSELAYNLLRGWLIDDKEPIERFFCWTAHLQELLDEALAEPTGNEHGGGDGYKLTFDGWNGAARVRCGIYDRHKAIEKQRQARDAAIEADQASMEASPLYGSF